jgi:anti-sigma B factor antagonist
VQIEEQEISGITVLHLSAPREGEFSRELFLPQIDSILDAGARRIVVNLEGMRWLNSTAIGLLLAAHRAAERVGATMVMAGANRRIREIMKITGMLQLWKSYPSVGNAVEEMAQAREMGAES